MRLYLFTIVVVIGVTIGFSTATAVFAQSRDAFTYDPQAVARAGVRNTIANSVYNCAKSYAFGDIQSGARSRRRIKNDPRLVNCLNYLRSSGWFKEREVYPLFDAIVDRAINDVIATGSP
jgi:hypothetical protein